MTTFRDYLKLKAAALERVAQQGTAVVPVEAAPPATDPQCEFCPPGLGAAGCGVCRVLDGVSEAEMMADRGHASPLTGAELTA